MGRCDAATTMRLGVTILEWRLVPKRTENLHEALSECESVVE